MLTVRIGASRCPSAECSFTLFIRCASFRVRTAGHSSVALIKYVPIADVAAAGETRREEMGKKMAEGWRDVKTIREDLKMSAPPARWPKSLYLSWRRLFNSAWAEE